ncbi:MAG TPA: hypothetical protein VLB51_02780 [Methylomirabilota bacterium]|nr:hypothetical protein [Methylomirabilota bacterium]
MIATLQSLAAVPATSAFAQAVGPARLLLCSNRLVVSLRQRRATPESVIVTVIRSPAALP